MLRRGNWSAALARSPAPEDEGRVHMFHDLLRRTPTVSSGIFEQFTQLMVCQALPDHRHPGRWEMPIGCSRRHLQSCEIVILMTGTAFDGIHAVSVRSAMNLHGVAMAVVTLPRKVTQGMAIHTARMAKHRDNRFESRSRAGIGVRAWFMYELGRGMVRSLSGNPKNQ
jgi:hypothetical protein